MTQNTDENNKVIDIERQQIYIKTGGFEDIWS